MKILQVFGDYPTAIKSLKAGLCDFAVVEAGRSLAREEHGDCPQFSHLYVRSGDDARMIRELIGWRMLNKERMTFPPPGDGECFLVPFANPGRLIKFLEAVLDEPVHWPWRKERSRLISSEGQK